MSDEGDDRTGDPPEEPRPRPVGRRAPQHHPDPVQRADRGARRRLAPADGHRPRPPGRRKRARQRHPGRRDHGFGAHLVRHRPQAARGQPGRDHRRRRQDAGQCRPRPLQPVDAAARRFPGDRRGRAADAVRAARRDPSPDHRQDPLRHLERGDALLSDGHLPPPRSTTSCAPRRPTATGSRGSPSPSPTAPTACPT